MPKVADYRLAWSVTEQTYQVQNTREHALLDIVPESPAWFSWLEQASSFAFRGQGGHYTARKESRAHGQTYWYAYLGTGQQLSKKYLGKSQELTLARLEEVAARLAAQAPELLGAVEAPVPPKPFPRSPTGASRHPTNAADTPALLTRQSSSLLVPLTSQPVPCLYVLKYACSPSPALEAWTRRAWHFRSQAKPSNTSLMGSASSRSPPTRD